MVTTGTRISSSSIIPSLSDTELTLIHPHAIPHHPFLEADQYGNNHSLSIGPRNHSKSIGMLSPPVPLGYEIKSPKQSQ